MRERCPNPRLFRGNQGPVELLGLCLYYTYAGLIEGSARSRVLYLEQLDALLRKKPRGLLVVELREQHERTLTYPKEWLPGERVHVELSCMWTPPGEGSDGSSSLEIIWFQETGEDPFPRLQAILDGIRWEEHAIFKPWAF
jgi:hypothetical protein